MRACVYMLFIMVVIIVILLLFLIINFLKILVWFGKSMWRPEDNTWESLFPLPSAEAVSLFFLLCKLSLPTLPASELLQSAPPTLL